MVKSIFITIVFVLTVSSVSAQVQDTSWTSRLEWPPVFNEQRRNEEAQSGAMGEIGVVAVSGSFTTAFNQNPALLTQGKKYWAVNTSIFKYWLNGHLGAISGVFALPKHAFGISARLSSTRITLTDIQGQITGQKNEYSYTAAFQYAFQPVHFFSVGTSLRLIGSNFADFFTANNRYQRNAFTFDLGVAFNYPIKLTDQDTLRVKSGVSFTNLGPKIEWDNEKYFSPAEFRIGLMPEWSRSFSSKWKSTLAIAYQISKPLVPTLYSPDAGLGAAWFGSFNDAPGGTQEELQELRHQLGMSAKIHFLPDANLRKSYYLAFRQGAFLESENKGARRYYTTGFGLGGWGFYFDAAFMVGFSNPIFNDKYRFNVGYSTFFDS